jgi:hypothetical protein
MLLAIGGGTPARDRRKILCRRVLVLVTQKDPHQSIAVGEVKEARGASLTDDRRRFY